MRRLGECRGDLRISVEAVTIFTSRVVVCSRLGCFVDAAAEEPADDSRRFTDIPSLPLLLRNDDACRFNCLSFVFVFIVVLSHFVIEMEMLIKEMSAKREQLVSQCADREAAREGSQVEKTLTSDRRF